MKEGEFPNKKKMKCETEKEHLLLKYGIIGWKKRSFSKTLG